MAMTVESAKQAVAEKHGYKSWEDFCRVWLFNQEKFGDDKHEMTLESYRMVDDELARLTDELEKHRWIPVEERPPIENTTVEVILKKEVDGLSGRQNRIRGCNYLGGYFVHRGREYYPPAQITHWRYLPELP